MQAAARPPVHCCPRGGQRSARNAQGLCEHCNYAKQAIGWPARPRAGPRHTVETTTPTGHRYLSTAAPIRRGTRLRMETYPLDIWVGEEVSPYRW